eukprot:Platyproteum_vivax@DN4383_c0_g1_i1.p1
MGLTWIMMALWIFFELLMLTKATDSNEPVILLPGDDPEITCPERSSVKCIIQGIRDGVDRHPRPQPEQTYCTGYNSCSCCQHSVYDDSETIANHWKRQWKPFFDPNGDYPQCSSSFLSLNCALMCSPRQSLFVDVKNDRLTSMLSHKDGEDGGRSEAPSQIVVQLCEEDCVRLFYACVESKPLNHRLSLGQLYGWHHGKSSTTERKRSDKSSTETHHTWTPEFVQSARSFCESQIGLPNVGPLEVRLQVPLNNSVKGAQCLQVPGLRVAQMTSSVQKHAADDVLKQGIETWIAAQDPGRVNPVSYSQETIEKVEHELLGLLNPQTKTFGENDTFDEAAEIPVSKAPVKARAADSTRVRAAAALGPKEAAPKVLLNTTATAAPAALTSALTADEKNKEGNSKSKEAEEDTTQSDQGGVFGVGQQCGFCFTDCCCWPVWSASMVIFLGCLALYLVALAWSAALFTHGFMSRRFQDGGGAVLILAAVVGCIVGGTLGGTLFACVSVAFVLAGGFALLFGAIVLIDIRGGVLGALGGMLIALQISMALDASIGWVCGGTAIGLVFGAVFGYIPWCGKLRMNAKLLAAKRKSKGGRNAARLQQPLVSGRTARNNTSRSANAPPSANRSRRGGALYSP